MNKTDNRHYNRKTKRLLSLEMDYYCAYKGQETQYGKVQDVKYLGNTVYGRVYLQIDEQWYVMVIEKKMPAFRDLNKAILASCPEPQNILV